MNNPSNSHASQQVWKFLHGEMDPAEKSAFELRVREDAKLESELRAQRRLHRLMINAGRVALADRLLAEFQAEQAVPAAPRAGRLLRFPGRSGLLALAACAAIVAGVVWTVMPRSPLRWESPRVIATAWMGSGEGVPPKPVGNPPPPGKYSNESLLDASRGLIAAVDRVARGLDADARRELNSRPLRLSVQEIFAGQVTVALEVPDGEPWTTNLATLADLQARTPALAEQMVAHLRGRSAHPSP